MARRAPRAAAIVLRVVSWAHFGSGDAAFARQCGSPRVEVAETLVRGAVPLAIGGRSFGSAAALLACCAYAGVAGVAGTVADLVDVIVPGVALYIAPPRLGFGAYFAAWHAPRHLALLLVRDPRGGTYQTRFRRFAREAAPNVLVASGFGMAAYMLRGPAARTDDVVAALILGITVPHQLAVWAIEYTARGLERP